MRQRRTKARTTGPQQSHEQSESSDSPTVGREHAASYPDDSPTIDSTLRERAREIIAKLEAASPRNEATTLEAWMAHYIAELMHRADDSGAAANVRASAARECGEVIRELWQLQLAREQARLGHLIYQDRWRTAPNAISAALADALRRPASAAAWPAGDRLIAFFTLAQVDEELVRALYLASLRVAPGTDARSDQQGEGRPDPKEVQEGLDRAIAAAATAFPEVAKANSSDITSFNATIASALERTFRVRARLLGTLPDIVGADELRGAPQRRPRAARKQPKKRIARHQRRSR